jgi:hypothetical protein
LRPFTTQTPSDIRSLCIFRTWILTLTLLFIQFGTVLNPTSAQSALTTEMQKRYQAFLATGNPNVAGVPTWTAAGTTDVHPLVLGGSGEVAVGACVPTFWGQNATYDYQFFDE